MLGRIAVPIYFLARAHNNQRDGDEENDDDDVGDGNGTTPRASTFFFLPRFRLAFSQLQLRLAVLLVAVAVVAVVPPPFLARASLARHRAFSRFFFHPLARSARSGTIRLPFSVSNTTHGPSGGLVRGSILTAGVARTPILSVPANRRVSSKVSLLLQLSSSVQPPSGHPSRPPSRPPPSLAILFYHPPPPSHPSRSPSHGRGGLSPLVVRDLFVHLLHPRTPTSTPFRSFLGPAIGEVSQGRQSFSRRLLSRENRAATRSKITAGDRKGED